MELLLIKYIEDDTIEGYVKDYKEYKQWLIKHNANRKAEGELKENTNCFEVISIKYLL